VEDWASRGRTGRHPMETEMNEPMVQPEVEQNQPPVQSSGPDNFWRFLKILVISVGVLVAGWFAFLYWLAYMMWG
jgi:hypothetical protein